MGRHFDHDAGRLGVGHVPFPPSLPTPPLAPRRHHHVSRAGQLRDQRTARVMVEVRRSDAGVSRSAAIVQTGRRCDPPSRTISATPGRLRTVLERIGQPAETRTNSVARPAAITPAGRRCRASRAAACVLARAAVDTSPRSRLWPLRLTRPDRRNNLVGAAVLLDQVPIPTGLRHPIGAPAPSRNRLDRSRA